MLFITCLCRSPLAPDGFEERSGVVSQGTGLSREDVGRVIAIGEDARAG